ncbi:WxL domain-containing protein [Enterococcus faecalis]|nr:WxL domain-containing protein [Enterococcus faecalis]EGO7899971.1 WxL domain-containing protein [Enterococcus faecalis]EGO7931358.1 WxL domain-containing protein [Enterococcus faecalis]EGO9004620.1 WxL domain-containing protein [Enterococcus faecalis]EGO9160105.1 WxL domain-containing protein [Enterococcus faecalis]
MVYEEATEFPEATFQLGFVNQDGNLVKPDDIVISYDYVGYTGRRGVTSSFVYNTIAPNQKAGTSGNLKNVVLPKDTVPLPQKVGDLNGNTAINFAISLPKYYTGLSIYDKTGKINSKYPLPPSHFYKNNVEINGLLSDSTFVIWLAVDKATNGSYVRSESLTTNALMDSSFPRMRRDSTYIQGVENTYFSFDAPVYYHLTQRKVTESFKDTAGATIPAPTGFTQGKQTSITSNNYTFKQAGTLPETYKESNGKTYKFKGWYKGKTKPNTLTTTKAPSYAVTYDDNDDLNVVYEEIEAFDFPALTYQFGFVDESGKRVDASTIGLTYDKWRGELLTNNVNDWKTVSLEKGQVAPTKNNLKEIAYPAQSLEIMSGRSSQYSAANLTFTPPRYYEKMSVYNKSGAFDTAYPFPTVKINNSTTPLNNGPQLFQLKKSNNQSFIFNQTTGAAPADIQVPAYLRELAYDPANSVNKGLYHILDKPIYYYLTNRKVTENFVDINGTKITPPTGFTQGKQTVINSDPYTFKQSGTLPDTYTTGGKTYKFKGWYKGKTKPNTLTTTKAPSYAVTYDDNDDLNVVYEEATEFPEETYQFGFVNEAGQLVNPDDINLTYDYKSIVYRGTGAAGSTVSFGTIANNQSGVKVGNLRQVTLPAKNIAQPTVVGWNGEAFANFSIKLPKYYKSLNLYDKTGKIDPKYPLPVKTTVSSVSNDTVQPEANVIAELTLTQRADGSFTPREIYSGIDSSVRYPPFLRRTVSYSSSGSITALYQTISGPVYYHLTNRKVTENFVDTSGAKITPPAGFTQGNQIPMTSNTFKYTSAKALPASYSAGGKTYVFQGWYKGKTKPNTLTTSTTPAYNTTFDDNDDMTAVYKEANISANLTMRGAVDVIDNGATMEYWEVLLKNTGEAPLTSVKIKPTTDWAAGISTPTELFILGTGQNTKVRPITKEQWEAGFEIPLDSSIPVGGQLTINLLGTKVTGQPNQVLKAAVEVTGNFNKLTASDTVRIKDLDQETKEPTGEGFISVPTFNFGQVGVAGSTQQHSLKKAADYYGNGTRNPYLRIKKTQPNWSLTAQLSQPKSATDSLPTATRLLLGAAPVSSFSNYNQPTELKNAVGTTSAISLNANNTATRIIANQQFTGSNIYQLDFTFNNVKLEVPANQGVKGQQYQAAVTWNLVTGP